MDEGSGSVVKILHAAISLCPITPFREMVLFNVGNTPPLYMHTAKTKKLTPAMISNAELALSLGRMRQ